MKVTQKRKARKRNPEKDTKKRTEDFDFDSEEEDRKKKKKKEERSPQVRSPIAKRKDQGKTQERKSIKAQEE